MSGVKRDYIEEVLKQVKFLPDRAGIRQELEEHIEDMLEFAPEMDEAGRDAYIREHMGDPVETGRALDREHHVVLGWIWLVSRWAMRVAVVLCLPLALYYAQVLLLSGFQLIERYGFMDDPVAVIEVDETARIDDLYLHVDELVRYEDGKIRLHYWYLRNPLFGYSYEISLNAWMRDDVGNDLRGGGSSSAGIIGYNSDDIENLDIHATKVIIDYDHYGRKFYLEIPLEWEVVK